MNDDIISRQAAIETLTVGAELLRRVLDNADIVGTERAKYEWGLGLIESYISDMKELPSAQPETCAYWDRESNFCALDRPSAQPDRRYDEWCTDCKEYDQEKHCCPRWNRVIRTTLNEAQRTGRWIDAEKAPFDMWYATCSECGKRQTLEYLNYCPNCGLPMETEEQE